jgi:hypothetical protein
MYWIWSARKGQRWTLDSARMTLHGAKLFAAWLRGDSEPGRLIVITCELARKPVTDIARARPRGMVVYHG